jgi:hypothetical protein
MVVAKQYFVSIFAQKILVNYWLIGFKLQQYMHKNDHKVPFKGDRQTSCPKNWS